MSNTQNWKTVVGGCQGKREEILVKGYKPWVISWFKLLSSLWVVMNVLIGFTAVTMTQCIQTSKDRHHAVCL